jgi:cysteinyl-tRNA synthetase
MSELRVTNTMSGRKEKLVGRESGRIKLFTCGPSVYRRQHVGNYRTYLFEDVLHKYLEHLGLKVERLLNLTDIEDKAIEAARQEGVSVVELRRPVEERFFEECRLLGIHLPEDIPRATTSVESAVDLIKRLLDRGHAYWHEGEVFFDPLSYEGFGRLFGLDMSRWPEKRVRFRRDTYRGQRWNLGDFILWHKRTEADGDVWWETELGEGRPAWNVQDPAMIKKRLGFEIDIQTGGIDNLYRHHDYTLAIMEGASGRKFCNYWLHGGHLLIEGEKMSKSKGNVTFVDDLLARGFQPHHIRFFLLYGHYRKKLDMRPSRLEEMAGKVERIRHLAGELLSGSGGRKGRKDVDPEIPARIRQVLEERMGDDLDFAGAFDGMGDQLVNIAATVGTRISQRSRREMGAVLEEADKVLGVFGLV